jgi:predicted amidohydrolase YtcJ
MKKQVKSSWQSVKPDLIMFNGNVVMVDGDFSFAEAVAVKGNKILGVGSSSDIKKLADENTQLLDLKGATVLPGINDAHCHLNGFGLERPPFLIDLAYPNVKSMDEIRAAMATKVAEVGPGK